MSAVKRHQLDGDIEWASAGWPDDEPIQRFANVVHACLVEIGHHELAAGFVAYANEDGSFYAEPFDDLDPVAAAVLERAESIARQAS